MDFTTVTLLQLFSALIPMRKNRASEVSSCPQEALQSTHPVTRFTCSHAHLLKQLLLSRSHMKIPSLRSFRRQTKARNQQLCLTWSLYKQCFLLDIPDFRNSFPISTKIPESHLSALPPFLPSSLGMALQAQASLPGAHWYFLKENRAVAQSSTTWHLLTDWTSQISLLATRSCCISSLVREAGLSL